MAKFGYQQQVERLYYKHGLFMSNHPVLMICVSAIVILGCCYPLLNLPLPGSEPTEFLTPSSDFGDRIYTSGKELPYDHLGTSVDLPQWFQAQRQVAYVQQFIVRSIVHPWDEKEMILTDAYRAPLAKIFTLLEEIDNFHLEEDESHSVTKQCLRVTESVIKQRQRIKPLFPENSCLILSPASFWKKSVEGFRNDPNIMHTIHKYQGKAIETSPSVKELLFGVPSKESGVNNFIVRNRQRAITYAITVVLKTYDRRMIFALKEKLQALYPSKRAPGGKKCTEGSDCENSSDSGGAINEEVPFITHIHFKPQIGSHELIPLLSTYFIMGCYIYFSVKKINFVKSKLGMAFSAVISIMASLMISVGLCSLFGLKPTLNGGEIFPYLVIIIGLENILVITKSVVATPIHLEVDKRVALGLSREGCSITKNLLLELILIGLGYFTYVPEIQEFCTFAVVAILSDYLMHMVFFTTVLSIDIRRLDITEDMYSQPQESESDDENFGCAKRNRIGSLHSDRKSSSGSLPGNTRGSVFEHLRASNRRKRKSESDEIHKLETGGKSITILKIPKRLRVLFFWADTRMVQRGLMVFLVIWFALLIYGDPFGSRRMAPPTKSHLRYKMVTLEPIQAPTKEPFSIFKQDIKTVAPEPLDTHGNLLWSKKDLQLYRRLSFRHWPTLFSYYNLTLAGRFVSILPAIPLTVTIPPEEAIKSRHASEMTKQHDTPASESVNQDDSMSQQFSPYSYTGPYPMTGLDYYLTLLLGAVSGMMMVFLLTVLYRCICTRNYANWTHGKRKGRQGTAKYKSSIGDTMPLVLSGHTQVIDCLMCDDGLLASTDLSGEIRVWDVLSGDCNCIIHRVQTPVPVRDPAEGATDAKPTPLGYQETDRLKPVHVNPFQPPRDAQEFDVASMQRSAEFYVENRDGGRKWGHKRQRSWHNTPKLRRTHHRSGSWGDIIPDAQYEHSTPNASWLSPFSPEINLLPTVQTEFAGLVKENPMQIRRRATAANTDDLAGSSTSIEVPQHSSSGYLELGEGDARFKLKTCDGPVEEFDGGSTGYDFQGIFHGYYLSQIDPEPDISSLGGLSRLFQRNYFKKRHRPLSTTTSLPIGIGTYPIRPQRNSVPTTPPLGLVQRCMPPTPGLVNQRDISGRYDSNPSSPQNQANKNTINEQNATNLWGSWESGLGATTPKSGVGSWGSPPGSPVEMENGPSVWCMVGVRDFIMTGCEDGRIEVWDGKSGLMKCAHDVGKAGVVGLVAEDRKLVAARVNGSLDFFSMEATFFHIQPIQYRGAPRTRLGSMSYSDVLTLQLLYTVKSAHQQPITAFKMTMGRVLTGSCDHTLKLFTVQDARCLFTLYGHKEPISTLYMDPGPPAGAASGSSDGTVRLWDLPSGRCLHMLDEHKAEVTSVQCSNSHIVSIAQDDRLCIWSRRTGMLLHVRCLDLGCSTDMCLLGSSWCVTGGLGFVLLWDLRNGDLVRKIKLSEEANGVSSRVTKLVPVANLAVACDTGKEVQVVRFPSVLEKVD